MGKSYTPVRTKPRLQQKRKPLPGDLLKNAHPDEIDWYQVAPVLKKQTPGACSFVYFIGEEDDGPVKIGTALDPIQRLRGLQIGNPRRLRIEALIYGDFRFESTLHEYWRTFAIGGKVRKGMDGDYARETEWFAPEARERIIEAAIFISNRQTMLLPEASADDMYKVIGEVMTDFGYEIVRGDELRFLAKGSGYVTRRLRPS